MPTWMWVVGYLIPALVTAVGCSRYIYKDNVVSGAYRVKVRKSSMAKAKRPDGRVMSQEEIEIARLDECAREATVMGFWLGIFWPVVVVFGGIYQLIVGLMSMSNLLSKKDIQRLQNELDIKRAKALTEQFEEERKNAWKKEAGEEIG